MAKGERTDRGSHRLDTNGNGQTIQEDDTDPTNSSMVGNGSTKKRKRTVPTDKKFECKHEGCGKSYSRAEHLYRHQLNHTPKQIYRCDFPDCYRSFVRQDLCVRHRERHTTNGSQLQRRDSFAQTASHLPAVPSSAAVDEGISRLSTAPAVPSVDSYGPAGSSRPSFLEETSVSLGASHSNRPTAQTNYRMRGSTISGSMDSSFPPLTPQTGYGSSDLSTKRSNSSSTYSMNSPKVHPTTSYNPPDPSANYGSVGPSAYHDAPFSPGQLQQRPESVSVIGQGRTLTTSESTGTTYPNLASVDSATYVSQVRPSGFSTPGLTSIATGPYPAAELNAFDSVTGIAAPDPGAAEPGFDPMGSFAYPVFGGETYNRSPFAMADDFAAWLFNESATNMSPVAYTAPSGIMPAYSDPTQMQNSYYTNDTAYSNYLTSVIPQHPMSVTSILDSGPPQAIMSEDKRQELLHLMITRFNEPAHSAVSKRKDGLLEGDMDEDGHVLSLRMMQTYIGSYWYHLHPQLPILHRPTFTADTTPNLLLLAVMAIGASTLDKAHGAEVTETAADLANFVAWHLRWEIFMDGDFRPPAKLWVFQTLLLLEIYEKMFSTRALHERAHIHHDTTLTLMRRGSSLIGRSAFDSPSSAREDRQGHSATGSTPVSEDGPEESWAHWIKAEATRRVAFAAFVLDSTHAAMFGHSAKMVAHEMRVPLPCDEALWSATSAAEVARMQSSLNANGVKPTMFLDGLKKTLNGQIVRTNPFGRTIIMAGLLSVSWHMNQRDLQVSSLGVTQALGGRDKWRSSLLRSFDHWKHDFDQALAQSAPAGASTAYRQRFPMDDENTFEARTVLHHLAHMASHVDIVDCQIFAGAGRLLGRSISPKDYSTAREKMTERWASKASARDATFYALKFLAQCLLTDECYSAREDFLLNRPWVLYFAGLVVWCYGYALEGPLVSSTALETVDERRRDMRQFLERVGGVREPSDLETVKGRNQSLGLLMTLRETFQHTRWELLHEAANLLDSCIEKLQPVSSGRP
ncbi:C2H2 finger domain protein, putative [Paecilomyces variotii No. 5]|uniref:C2H2 finger domain protein, putative n=1 Tax=Byssochlamys spectabilis (strain No. 5 / NBRC 109023) TaxID=1356009 RepID=V5I0D3_BYSSN|nr:C2H2 finger domain protein, putative [Paecilomyces variotii No. 5]